MSGVRKSTPATLRPRARAVRSASRLLSGWIVPVKSVAVPPVEMLAVLRRSTRRPAAGTLAKFKPCPARTRSTSASREMKFMSLRKPDPRLGLRFSFRTSVSTEFTPSPTTAAGFLIATAMSRPSTTSSLWSSPGITDCNKTGIPWARIWSAAFRTWSGPERPTKTLRPFPPVLGLATSG